MKKNLIYIDDKLEPYLNRYLHEKYDNSNGNILYKEIRFDVRSPNAYQNLIENDYVRNANIIIIDSCLFENRSVSNGKFTGEEFRLILKKYFPYIEVIVITQNTPNASLKILSKYNSDKKCSVTEFYDRELLVKINEAIDNIDLYYIVGEKLKGNNDLENVLREKILNSLKGVEIYDEFTKNDIDELVKQFKIVEELMRNE